MDWREEKEGGILSSTLLDHPITAAMDTDGGDEVSKPAAWAGKEWD